ncbi:hypothetical protein K2173_025862 [Erythroxylum novogranatense]|uniref:Helicase and polymerase-containing protein TEBICHI n=1 Tax=Erythroxylum novogranatense TaxID=1862640 RepID=A0AAV8SI62_9ROSI|nr:hypothetical protein K2173_025862 [Erythroxylum novogranatense]
MASDSPCKRIDQFFASRKRKSLSPALKSGKVEKDARIIVEGSPSAKCTLDSYLVDASDNERAAAKSPSTTCGLLSCQDPVRRNLELGIDKAPNSKEQNEEPCSFQQKNSITSQQFETVKRETSEGSSNVGNVPVGDLPKDSLTSGPVQESSELKQFASDFLSLYCGELQSTATSPSKAISNDRKRHGSLPLENKKFKKKLCLADRSCSEEETAGFIDKKAEDMQSVLIVKTGKSVFSASGEVQKTLRKCNEVSKSAIEVPECSPASSMVRARHGTPNSARGSSMFSPGEAFWNEAIHVADCLFDKTELAFVPNDIGNQKPGNQSMEMLDEAFNKSQKVGSGFSLDLIEKHIKSSAGKVSPMPVKQLDFLFEEKNLDVVISHCSAGRSEVQRGTEQSEIGYINTISSAKPSTAVHHIRSLNNEGMRKVQEKSVQVVNNTETGLLDASMDSITSNSTVSGVRILINPEYGEVETPSSVVSGKDQLDISNWLPSEVCIIYKKRGISKLYPWQVDCLQVDGVLQRRNLVYCASTSAGKSFVAEILMLRRVISTGKIALLVLPYVSICAEKAEHMEGLLEPLGKHVRSYYGNQGGGTLPRDTSVAVCTIEKANSLINRLLEEGRLSEVGIIVIDELHMVGDQSRGYLLELMLTKLRYAAGEGNLESSSGESSGTSSKDDPAHGLQIIGMSATMPNVAAVAEWLQAALYQTEFRPVPLEEHIKVGNTIYNKKMDVLRTMPKAADLCGKDPDHIVELCNEVVQEGHSVLIFCSSRKGCESTARHVSKFLKKWSVTFHNDSEFSDIASAVDALRKSPAGLDPTLEETFPSGVAYHHAGLTVEEREIIETCYRRGLLRVLTATSTLAAGVNLPARRVIFRQPRIGRDFIDGTRYRQMAGRAGRTGIDTRGESVLICNPEELKRIMGILNECCPPLQSCLSEDKNGMTHAILEVVASGIVQTADDIHRYVRCTLLNSTKPFKDVVKSAQESLRWLCHRKFLEWNEDSKLYSTTPLGRAAFGSSLCPEESLIVLDDLSRAREGFVLASDLHLVYLVTPVNVEIEPDWELFYERFMELSALDQSVGNRVGVSEPFLMRMAHGAPMRTFKRSTDNLKALHGAYNSICGIKSNNMSSHEQILRVCKRFYVALILSRLVQEVPVVEVCEAFKVARGLVQALQENAGRFASMVSVFCERLGWHDLEGLIIKFQNRVSFGVRAEIVELTTIPHVKGSRARALYKAGLRTPLAIAEASIPEIMKALFESASWSAQEGSAQRRIQLGVAKKIKNGARKIVLDKAEEARVVAFSAFTSLGLNVPQFSHQLLYNNSGGLVQKAVSSPLFIHDKTNACIHVELRNHSFERSGEGNLNSDNDDLKSGDKIMKGFVGGLVAPAEMNPQMHCIFAAKSTPVLDEKPTLKGGYDDDVRYHKGSADMVPSSTVKQDGDEPGAFMRKHNCITKECTGQLCTNVKEHAHEKGPISASSISGGFDSFLNLWDKAQEFYFDIHYNKRKEISSVGSFEIHGIAICWENSPIYYVNLPKYLLQIERQSKDYLPLNESLEQNNIQPPEKCLEMVKIRWNRILEIMGKVGVKKVTWNLKIQIQVLRSAVISVRRLSSLNPSEEVSGLKLVDNSYLMLSPINIREGIDLCIAAWILWPDEERSSFQDLEREVKKRLPSDAVEAANWNGRWMNQTRRAAHNGCCRRVAQTRALCSVLWKRLISEGLLEAFMKIEKPLVTVLADMEFWGIGVDLDGCIQARNLLQKKLKNLEKEAYKLAGRTFSLHASADIANLLYTHLQLPMPKEQNKGKHHPSTDKHSLDLLRHEHPIIPVIREHRTLSKLLNCTLGSICSLARLSMRSSKYTLHGHWLQTSTATGRLSMEEPNLQCVEHMVDFKMSMQENEVADAPHHRINARHFFVPTEVNWFLVTADYSQVELRLMAHFSKDALLIELLSKPQGDIFTMIAALWTRKPEDSVGSNDRDQTKRLVYGILYGMGANKLAKQLDCSSEEAAEKIRSFKSTFPGVGSWLQEAVVSCRKKGYVETLKGRKRFLSKINFGNSKEKSKAERQAVNSICQGSAADIIKIAMINIYSVIVEGVDLANSDSPLAAKFHMLKGRCRILLQVHDELVLEVDPTVIKEAACLLQTCMESAALLLVPLQVKVKVGRTWGSLEPIHVDKYASEVLHGS